MISSSPALACRYALKDSGWMGDPAIVYFIVEDLDVTYQDGVAEIMDCAAVDVVVVV